MRWTVKHKYGAYGRFRWAGDLYQKFFKGPYHESIPNAHAWVISQREELGIKISQPPLRMALDRTLPQGVCIVKSKIKRKIYLCAQARISIGGKPSIRRYYFYRYGRQGAIARAIGQRLDWEMERDDYYARKYDDEMSSMQKDVLAQGECGHGE